MFDTQDVCSVFSEKAALWDEKRKFIIDKSGISDRLVRILPELVTTGMRVLDAGAGLGKIVKRFKELNIDLDVFASDISFEMTKRLASFFVDFPSVNIFLSDIQNTCFADNSFNVVTIQQVLHHLPFPEQGLREISRVLKKDGTLVLLTVGNKYQEGIVPYLNLSMVDDPLGRISAEALKLMISEAGLHLTTIFDDYFTMRFNGLNQYYDFMNAIGSVDKTFNYRTRGITEEEKKYRFYDLIRKEDHMDERLFCVTGHYITVVAKK